MRIFCAALIIASIASAASVWGSVASTKDNSTASTLGVQRKLGYLRNLPVFLDEISDEEKMDVIRRSLGTFTEGGDGVKLDRNRNNVVLSRRAWLEETQKEQRDQFLADLKPGVLP